MGDELFDYITLFLFVLKVDVQSRTQRKWPSS